MYFFLPLCPGGNKLQSTGNKAEDSKMTDSVKVAPNSSTQSQEVKMDPMSDAAQTLAALQSDVQPVGHDYVEEVRCHFFTFRLFFPMVQLGCAETVRSINN